MRERERIMDLRGGESEAYSATCMAFQMFFTTPSLINQRDLTVSLGVAAFSSGLWSMKDMLTIKRSMKDSLDFSLAKWIKRAISRSVNKSATKYQNMTTYT